MAGRFSAERLGSQYQRLLRCVPGEWRGVWSRYKPGDTGRLAAQPLQAATCAFTLQDGGASLAQTNTYYQGLDVSKVEREAHSPVLSEEGFNALPSRNMIM